MVNLCWKAVALVTLAATTFAACGGDSPGPPPTPRTPTETATAPPRTSTPTAAPTPTPSPTATSAPSPTPQPTPTPSPTPAPTGTPSPTPSESEPTPTSTPIPSEPVEPDAPTPAVRPALPQSPVFEAPPGVYTEITVGASHACALTESGEAVCWDIESGAAWGTPPGTYPFIEAEGDDTCAISDEGAIVCWPAGGGPFPERRPDPSRDAPPGRYQAFSWASDEYYIKGLTHACGVTEGGEAVCWTSQELETDYSHELALPDLPPGEYTTVDVRYSFFGWGQESLIVCGLTRTEGAVCSKAARAQGSAYPQSTWSLQGAYASVAVSGRDSCGLSIAGEIEGCGVWDSRATRYVAVSPGEKHVCAATDVGHLECWVHGSGWFLQGEVFVMDPPPPSSGGYVGVGVGHAYACALDETGRAICWGVRENKVAPPEPAPGPYVAVSDGRAHTCALTDEGQAVCWGWNNTGQAAVPDGRYKAISAGVTGTCALTEAGEMVCWGWDTYRHKFTSGAYRFIAMAPDQPLTCAVSEAGVAGCHGPLNFMEPVEFPGGPYRSVHVGRWGRGDRICALSEGGALVCRSSEDNAALSPPVDRPTVVSDGAGPLCFFTEAREIVCWGATGAWSPDLPAGDYAAISAGPNHGCALTEAGEVRCWGAFRLEARGGGLIYDHGSADPPPGRYTAINSGQYRVCAVAEGGEVVCWGETDYLQAPSSDPYW